MDSSKAKRNDLLWKLHREFTHPPGDRPIVDIHPKDAAITERRPLHVSAPLPEGNKTISWSAYFYSGHSVGERVTMRQLRAYMHTFLCGVYGVSNVHFRFTTSTGGSDLAYDDEQHVDVDCYLRLSHSVCVKLIPED